LILSERIVIEARSWIGTPYRHQASAKGLGCDCLGLVRGVWRNVIGPEPETVPAYSPDWGETNRREPLLNAGRRHFIERDLRDIAPGDVLLFRWRPHLPAKHCAILVAGPYADGGSIVHAYDAAGGVHESYLESWRDKLAAAFSFPVEEA